MIDPVLSPLPAPAGLQERILKGLKERRDVGSKTIAFDVAASASGISRVRPGTGAIEGSSARARDFAKRAQGELTEYLGGMRSYFSVPVDIDAAAPFQREVLSAARTIPFGEVRSYRWIAERIGSRGAVRAVGTALGRNPVPILVPCHRVLRTDGSLGGYAFGLDLKAHILGVEHETFALVGSATTRIVCRHGCPYERRIAERHRVVFASVREAGDVGYRPCRSCVPVDA